MSKITIFGRKILSKAETARGSSHQTHIGLHNTFFSNDVNLDQLTSLKYKEWNFRDLALLGDFIVNTDGTPRSPKLRKGNLNEINRANGLDSLYRRIVFLIHRDAIDKEWVLAWIIDEHNEITFILANEKMDEFESILGQPTFNLLLDEGSELEEIVTPSDSEKTIENLEDKLATGNEFSKILESHFQDNFELIQYLQLSVEHTNKLLAEDIIDLHSIYQASISSDTCETIKSIISDIVQVMPPYLNEDASVDWLAYWNKEIKSFSHIYGYCCELDALRDSSGNTSITELNLGRITEQLHKNGCRTIRDLANLLPQGFPNIIPTSSDAIDSFFKNLIVTLKNGVPTSTNQETVEDVQITTEHLELKSVEPDVVGLESSGIESNNDQTPQMCYLDLLKLPDCFMPISRLNLPAEIITELNNSGITTIKELILLELTEVYLIENTEVITRSLTSLAECTNQQVIDWERYDYASQIVESFHI